jgi:hypothetical protein
MFNIDTGVMKFVAAGLAESTFKLPTVDIDAFLYHKGKGRAYYEMLITAGANIESEVYRSQLRQILKDAFDAQIEALTNDIIRSVNSARPKPE